MRTPFFLLFFCSASLVAEPAVNPNQIIIIESILSLLNKGTNLIFDVDTILRVDFDFSIVPTASEVVQVAKERANVVAVISALDPVQVPLGYLVILLKARALIFNPIVDPVILARLKALGASLINGVVYVGKNTKADVLKAFFQPNRLTYYLARPGDQAIPLCNGSTQCTTLRYVPFEF